MMNRRSLALIAVLSLGLAAAIAWAAGLGVSSRQLTSIAVVETVPIPTPAPTPTPEVPTNAFLLDHLGNMVTTAPSPGQRSIGPLGGTAYWTAPANSVVSASNASNWSLTFVSNGQPNLAVLANVTVTFYWQAGGTTCTTPVGGRTFAQTGTVTVTGKNDREGYTINVPAVGGTVNRTFTSSDLLCLRVVNNSLLNNVGMRGGTTSTSGVPGMSRVTGSFVRN